MSTALDGEVAGSAGELTCLVWGYGAAEVDTDLGTSSPSSFIAAIENVANSQDGLSLYGSVQSEAGASGALYAAAQFQVTPAGAGQPYLSLLQPFESIGGIGDLGSSATLCAGDYSDTTSENAGSVVSNIASADPGALSSQIQSLLTAMVNAASPLTGALAGAAEYALAAGVLLVIGLFAYAQSKKA